MEPIVMELKRDDSGPGVRIAPEYADGLVAMQRVRDAFLKDVARSFALLAGYIDYVSPDGLGGYLVPDGFDPAIMRELGCEPVALPDPSAVVAEFGRQTADTPVEVRGW